MYCIVRHIQIKVQWLSETKSFDHVDYSSLMRIGFAEGIWMELLMRPWMIWWVGYYRNTRGMLVPAHDQLLLRYECQKVHSLFGEDKFAYDHDWLKNQICSCLEFWLGE
ncbi:hypothetical protein VNO80_24729 [Phaseolus coccineus]|uniref:Uncharacterized protein n=1 Tax=Phaseolus coccineus TaxID=3886 RepID=A0AAN9LSY7_PHACN